MLLRKDTLKGIREGDIQLAFRRWKRPTVKSGGTLMTALGQLSIVDVSVVTLRSITAAEAQAAGYENVTDLLAELRKRRDGKIYRVQFGALVADPRAALREAEPTEEERRALMAKLDRMDARASGGTWTRQVLRLIQRNPNVRAGDLCGEVDMELLEFKRNVRKLKNLGLTESLGVGYRLSARGEQILRGR